jgi:DNA-binding NarL/FixJ family response regulator
MIRRIALVGHCGADASFLRIAVSSATKGTAVVSANDDAALKDLLEGSVDLLLINRQLDWGFKTEEGIELIRHLRAAHPSLKMMLVSNYPDAQAAAVEAGALPGFGKREIGTPRVKQMIAAALGGA